MPAKVAREHIGGVFDLPDCNFDVRLDRTLLDSLEAQARWATSARLTDKQEVPNYLNFFYHGNLKAVAPESVALK